MGVFTVRESALRDGDALRDGNIPSSITPFTVLPSLDQLGCGVWRAFLQQIGSDTQIEFPYSQLSTGLKLSDSAQSTVSLYPSQINTYCCDVLADIYPFQYDLVLYRNSEQAFIGPIVDVAYGRSTITITAQDSFYWLEKRVCDVDLNNLYTDLGNIFKFLFTVAMGQDPIPGLELVVQEVGRKGSREAKGGEFIRVADSMRELAKSGLEFTTVGRKIYAWGIGSCPFPNLPTLLTEDFGEDITLQLAGTEYGNDIIVTGNNSEFTGYPYYGRHTAWDEGSNYPLITQVFSESNISSEAILADSALMRLERFRANPVLPNGAFAPRAQITYSQLVPGVEVDLALEVGCRTLIDTFKLESVDVSVDVSNGGSETITPRFVPKQLPLTQQHIV